MLEDLHWADHASLFLLRELTAELPASRLLVLATCREGAGDPWRTTLGDLARLPGLQVMPLPPLGEAAVDEILKTAGLDADPALARFVHARSEGNPLYVATLARVLAARPEGASDSDAVARVAGASAEISHLVSSLTSGLDQDTRDLLAAASVLGTDFGAELAAWVGGGSPDVLAALAAAELGDMEAADIELALLAQLAESTRLPLARWHLLRQQASRAALAGQFAVARDRSEQARRLAVRIQDLSGAGISLGAPSRRWTTSPQPRRCTPGSAPGLSSP